MNISGSEVTKDAADMILLDDDFSSIVNGVEEGRRIFDNLKKVIIYLLASNVAQLLPYISLILLQVPLPLSTVLILIIWYFFGGYFSVGTEIPPSLSLCYEHAELDIMKREPRNMTNEKLVSYQLLGIAYL